MNTTLFTLTGIMLFAGACWVWSVIFFMIVQKPLFMCVNRYASELPLGLKEIRSIYSHGFVSDAIVGSYLTAVPLIAVTVRAMIPMGWFEPFMTAYNVIISLAIGLLTAGDTLLYAFWNSKVDASVFAYMKSPKGATASVSTGYIISWALVWLVLSAIYFTVMQLIISTGTSLLPKEWMSWWGYPCALLLMLFAAGGLFAIIRGLGIRPNNPSVVYFHKNQFFNHSALNPGYNLIYSLGTRDDFKSQFRFYTPEVCDRILTDLFPTEGTPQRELLNSKRPNILLIIWESFGAEFSGVDGGNGEVTPETDRIARNGVTFTQCTAGSFRTDRGLVCILGGTPGQPTSSIIRYTRKIANLPALPRTLRDAAGYDTVAIHGGDLSIMHKSDYYLSAGHNRLISQQDFPENAEKCKWGVHDGPVFDRVFDEITARENSTQPWMLTVQTLSSHEPFDVPYSRLTDPVANSFAYTDHCLGTLVKRLEATPAWDNLLILCVADHGFNAPNVTLQRKTYSHIPLIMAGGAVKAPAVIDTVMSQTDLAATVLGQMGLDHSDFPFSRDVLADSYTRHTGFHTFYNGFMVKTPEGETVHDNISDTTIQETPNAEREQLGKATLQRLYDYLDTL